MEKENRRSGSSAVLAKGEITAAFQSEQFAIFHAVSTIFRDPSFEQKPLSRESFAL